MYMYIIFSEVCIVKPQVHFSLSYVCIVYVNMYYDLVNLHVHNMHVYTMTLHNLPVSNTILPLLSGIVSPYMHMA